MKNLNTKLLLILLFAPLCPLGQTDVDLLPVFTREDLIKDSIFRADPHLKLIGSINRSYSTDFDPTDKKQYYTEAVFCEHGFCF